MEEQVVNGQKVYGKVCIRRQRRKRQKLLVSELMMDYAQNSTLHGLRYTAERGRSLTEKLFWLLVFFVSVGYCSYLIRNVYKKWRDSPVIVTFNDYIVPVGNVPFPSVTICPQTKTDPRVFNYSEEYPKYAAYYTNKNESKEGDTSNFTKTEDIMTVCNTYDTAYSDVKITNFSLVNNLLDVSLKILDVFAGCYWRGTPVFCPKVFKTVLTFEGVCFNFNALSANEIFDNSTQRNYSYLETDTPQNGWTPDTGYMSYDDDVYPRRGRENGAKPDLEVILREGNKSDDIKCNTLKNGFKIFLQHPTDQPQSSLYYYAALAGQTSSLALKFNMLRTSDSLEGYPSDTRKCYFQNDRQLRYFRIYTANNCRLECQANYTLEICGCVWFHMPHNDSNQICTMRKWECVQSALNRMALNEMKAEQGLKVKRACRCFPECQSTYYDAEILKTEFDYKSLLKSRNITHNIHKFSTIEMYFKEPRFVSMKRSEMFGLTDFLANCGGLLGLFLGFSFLSIVEIVYFVTLRLYYILKRDLKAEKRSRVVIEKNDISQEKY